MTRAPEPPQGLPPGIYTTISGGGWSSVAAFQLWGSRLDPDVVTRAMGIEPHRAHRRGEQRTTDPETTHRTGGWSLRSDDVLSRDDHLDDHLRWLLDQLESRAHQLGDVVAEQELDAEFSCGVFMEAPICDFVLPPETIGRVAALGATLRLDIYASEDAERELIEIPEPAAKLERLDGD